MENIRHFFGVDLSTPPVRSLSKEDNGEFSVGMDEKDKIPTSVIDYTSKETIINSIEKYYKENGGMCP